MNGDNMASILPATDAAQHGVSRINVGEVERVS